MSDPYKMVFVSLLASFLLAGGLLFYRYIFPKKKINRLVLLLLISILPVISIFRNGTYESGDLPVHTSYLINFYENLKNNILLPQWAPILCGGKGCPNFMFEYILPFYIGSFFHLLGFSFLNSIKLLLASSFILSGIGMYLWLKTDFNKNSAFAGSIFYLFAPYHLEDLHFRVSVGEVLSFFPLSFIFYFTSLLIKTGKVKYFLLIIIFLILLILSHSSTTIAIIPLLFLYGFIKIFQKKHKDIKLFIKFVLSIIFAVGISCLYWLPALIEVKYNWISLSAKIGGFRPISEFLYSPARYGFLFQGNNGELRLIIGYPHLLVIILCIIALLKKEVNFHYKNLALCFLFFFFFYLLLMLDISKPILTMFPFLDSFVLIWRLLVPISLITSFIAAIVISGYKNKLFIFILCLFTIISTILNWGNRKMVPENIDNYKNEWVMYSEYYNPANPIYRKRYDERVKLLTTLPLARDKSQFEVLKGNVISTQLRRTPINHEYLFNVVENSNIRENTFYFPGWKVIANGKEIPINYEDKNNFGLITFQLKKGLYKINVIFTDTPIRKTGKFISFTSLIILFIATLFLFTKINKFFYTLFPRGRKPKAKVDTKPGKDKTTRVIPAGR